MVSTVGADVAPIAGLFVDAGGGGPVATAALKIDERADGHRRRHAYGQVHAHVCAYIPLR